MLDARWVRENIDVVGKALADRHTHWDVDRFLALDQERRELIATVEADQALRNEASKQIGALMKQGRGDEAEEQRARVREINDRIAVKEALLDDVQGKLDQLLLTIPNIPDPSVPVGCDESANIEVRHWGTPREFDFEPKAHWDLGPALGIIDFERAVKLAGSRFYLLGGMGARLERALISFMLDTHTQRGYKEWWPPYLANAATLTATGQLPKFEDDLFKTGEQACVLDQEGEASLVHGNRSLYLIPTAEVQLTNIHRDEILSAEDLPLRYCAYTPCFREEAGAAGRDTRGMIRVHQFDKVEMVKFAAPEQSYTELETMQEDAGRIMELLGLPYRVIVLCTGDMGFSAAKTYDLEVWMPSYGAYKEISSCSNCTDFQARRGAIRYKVPGEKGSKLLHTLNGSGLAVGRTFAAIIENYQQADGTVRVPEALVPYMGGLTVIEPGA